MKYKTTYFKVSLNAEISVSDKLYEDKINPEKLYAEIIEIETFLEKINLRSIPSELFKSAYNSSRSNASDLFYSEVSELNLTISETSDFDEILNKIHVFLKKNSNRFGQSNAIYFYDATSKIEELISKRKLYNSLNQSRYTNVHEQELNVHLNEIADDGWKLHTMTPIIKGFNKIHSKSSYGNADAYSFGHDVLEGFVLVWEKLE